MNCNYTIKLPTGGEIIIPASNILSSEDSLLNSILTSYYDEKSKERQDFENPKEALDNYLRKNRIKINDKLLNDFLKSDLKNPNESINLFIDRMNDHLNNAGLIDNLENAIWRWSYNKRPIKFNNNGKSETIGLNRALKMIQKAPDKNYYNIKNSLNVVGINSLSTEIVKLENKIEELNSAGITSSVEHTIYELLGIITNTENYDKKMFYPINTLDNENDTLVINDGSNPLIFYKDNSAQSLFLGMFKYLASNSITEAELLPILEEYNKKVKKENIIDLNGLTVNDFFLGGFDENGRFIDGLFHKLFNENNSETIRNIAGLLKNKSGKYLTKQMQSNILGVLSLLNPEKYKRNMFHFANEVRREYDKHRDANNELANTLKIKESAELLKGAVRDFHYSETTSISFGSEEGLSEQTGQIKRETNKPIEDAYNYLINNYVKYKDAIKFPKKGSEEFDSWNVIVDVKITPSGLLVQGNKRKHLFTGSFTLDLKKLEATELPIRSNKSAEKLAGSVVIIPPSGESTIPSSVVKRTVVPGASVTYIAKNNKKYTKVVEAVHPGGMRLSGNDFISNYNNVTQIVTNYDIIEDQEFTDEDSSNKFTSINKNYSLLKGNSFVEANHIIKYKDNGKLRYNRVVDVVGDSIYILIKSENGNHFVKAIKKSEVIETFIKNVYDNFNNVLSAAKMINAVANDFSVTEYSHSLFNNYELSSNGDYVVLADDSNPNEVGKLYKIINKEAEIVGELPESGDGVLKLSKKSLKNALGYLTSRDISSQFAIDVVLANSKSVKHKSDVKGTMSEVVYLIKKSDLSSNVLAQLEKDPDLDLLEDALLLDSNNFTKGRVGEKSFYYDNVDGKWIPNDKLNEYVDVTKEALRIINDKKGTNYSELYFDKNGNYIERYDTHLKKYIFDSFTNDTKLEVLSSGNYIVMKGKNGKTENKKYRILGVTNDTVTLEYVNFSQSGKLISIIKEVPKSEVLSNTAFYYILYGNENMVKLDKIYSENKKTKESKIELLTTISTTLKNIFNIPVEIVKDADMTSSQKARIKSEVQTDKNGNVISTKDSIVLNLNHSEMTEYDLVHEYLHLFNIALKYTNSELYENLLLDYKRWRIENPRPLTSKIEPVEYITDFSVLEEMFVEDITDFMQSKGDLPIGDYNIFKAGFLEAISTLGAKDIVLEKIKESDNPMVTLTTSVRDIFKTKNNGMYQPSLITFESNFRKWLSENIDNKEIEVKCN